jgi:hypothetical protein
MLALLAAPSSKIYQGALGFPQSELRRPYPMLSTPYESVGLALANQASDPSTSMVAAVICVIIA